MILFICFIVCVLYSCEHVDEGEDDVDTDAWHDSGSRSWHVSEEPHDSAPEEDRDVDMEYVSSVQSEKTLLPTAGRCQRYFILVNISVGPEASYLTPLLPSFSLLPPFPLLRPFSFAPLFFLNWGRNRRGTQSWCAWVSFMGSSVSRD